MKFYRVEVELWCQTRCKIAEALEVHFLCAELDNKVKVFF